MLQMVSKTDPETCHVERYTMIHVEQQNKNWLSVKQIPNIVHQQLEGLFKAEFSSVVITSDRQHLCVLLHGFVAHSHFQFLMVKAIVAQAKWHN